MFVYQNVYMGVSILATESVHLPSLSLRVYLFMFVFYPFLPDLQLDGWIARRYPSQQSIIGTALDPFADKFMMTYLTIAFTHAQLIPLPLACLIVGRDVGKCFYGVRVYV